MRLERQSEARRPPSAPPKGQEKGQGGVWDPGRPGPSAFLALLGGPWGRRGVGTHSGSGLSGSGSQGSLGLA